MEKFVFVFMTFATFCFGDHFTNRIDLLRSQDCRQKKTVFGTNTFFVPEYGMLVVLA